MNLSASKLLFLVASAIVASIVLYPTVLFESTKFTVHKISANAFRGVAPDGTEAVVGVGGIDDEYAQEKIARQILQEAYEQGEFRKPFKATPSAIDPWSKIGDPLMLETLKNNADSTKEFTQIVSFVETVSFPYLPESETERQLILERIQLERDLFFEQVETELRTIYKAHFQVTNKGWLIVPARIYKAAAQDFLKIAAHPKVTGIDADAEILID